MRREQWMVGIEQTDQARTGQAAIVTAAKSATGRSRLVHASSEQPRLDKAAMCVCPSAEALPQGAQGA